ncbi:MAG: ATP-binding protein [Myxococcota bacterium]
MACPICPTSLPSEARYCWGCGAPQPDPGATAGELRLATVLCYRLDGLSATREVAEALRVQVEDALLEGGGMVMRAAEPDDAEGLAVFVDARIGRVAPDEAIRSATRARAVVRRADDSSTVELCAGVATGTLLLERAEDEDDEMVAGLPIGLARRLADAAGPDEILVDEGTRRAAGQGLGLVEETPLTRPDAPTLLPVWRVDADAMPESGRPRGLVGDRVSGPLVGRDAALERARAWLDEALEESKLRRVIVQGPRGSGRTRFCRTLVDGLRGGHADLCVAEVTVRGRDMPAEPFHLLARLVRALVPTEGPDVSARQQRFRAGLDGLAEAAPTLEQPFVRSRLEQLVGLSAPDDAPVHDPEHANESAHAAVEALLDAVARRGPLLVVVEHLEDATPDRHRTLARLCGSVRDRPVALLLTALEAPESDAGWEPLEGHDEPVPLGPLSPDAGRVLVDQFLGRRDALPRDVATDIVEHAGGLPLLVQESLSALLDAGMLVEDPSTGSWHLEGDGLPSGFPDSLHALLAARLAQMPEREARVVRQAAVAGGLFWRGLVADLGEPQAALVLRRLEDRGLVRRDFEDVLPGHVGYAFTHRAARDVLRVEVPAEEAAHLHVRVARWLALHAGDAFHAWLGAIAWHFAEAGDHARATSYHLQAARQARSLGDLGQALDQLERARRSAPNRETAMEAALELAEARLLSGRPVDARRELKQALAWSEERGDLRATLTALVIEARAAGALEEGEAVERAVDRGLELAWSLGAREHEATLLVARARLRHARGHEEEALLAITRASELTAELGDRLGGAVTDAHRGRTLLHLGRLAEAREVLEATRAVAEDLQHQLLHARAGDGLGWIALVRGRADEAEEHLREVVDVFDRLGALRLSVPANLGLALLALERGGHTEAANRAAGALDRAEESGSPLHVALGRSIVGHVYGSVELGHHKLKARALSAAAIRHAKVERVRHLEEALLALEASEGAPRLFHGLAALFLAEYLLGRDPEDERGRAMAHRAACLLSGFADTPLGARCEALVPSAPEAIATLDAS